MSAEDTISTPRGALEFMRAEIGKHQEGDRFKEALATIRRNNLVGENGDGWMRLRDLHASALSHIDAIGDNNRSIQALAVRLLDDGDDQDGPYEQRIAATVIAELGISTMIADLCKKNHERMLAYHGCITSARLLLDRGGE